MQASFGEVYRVVAPVSPDPRNPGFFFPRNPGVFKQIHA